MPEVAEMEPKVISEGLNPFPSPCGWVWRRSLLNVYVFARRKDSSALGGAEVEEMVLFTPS